jgi:hypothetical protein
LNQYKQQDIHQMKQVGPEYEYLVQVIHLLYRQLADKSKCEDTCCFTGQSIITPQQQQQQQHICRPIIQSHSAIAGNMTIVYQNENNQLKESMTILMKDRDSLFELLQNKENELKVKDDIVKQLENDFEKMELQVSDLQKVIYCMNYLTVF